VASEYAKLMISLEANTRQFTTAMNSVQRTVAGVGASLKSFAQGIVAGAAMYKVVEGLKASVRAFGDFDQAIASSAAIMTGVTGKMQQEMRALALEMSEDGATSATELGKAYYYLASAGLNVKQSMAALPIVEQFAIAGMFEMEQATTLVMDAFKALGMETGNFKKDAEQMTRVTDVLVKANTLANASVEQFSTALTTKAAGALKLVGKDIEEGVAVLAAFADKGIKAQNAGTSLYIAMRDLQKAAVVNSATWEKLNLHVFDGAGEMLNMADIISQLERKFGGLSDEEKKSTALMLGFQDKSFAAIQSLLGSSDKIREFEKILRDAGGTTKDIAEKQMAGFNMQMKELWNSVVNAGIGIGKTLAPAVVVLTDALGTGVKALEHYIGRLDRVGQIAAEQNEGWLKTAIVGTLALDPIFVPLIAHLTMGPSTGEISDVKKQANDILDFVEGGTEPVKEFAKSLGSISEELGGEGLEYALTGGEGMSVNQLEEYFKSLKVNAVPALQKYKDTYLLLADALENKRITDVEAIYGLAEAWKAVGSALPKNEETQGVMNLTAAIERLKAQFAAGMMDAAPFQAQLADLESQLAGAQADKEGRGGFVEYMKQMYEGLKMNEEAMNTFNADFGSFAESIKAETQSPFEKYIEHIWKLDTVLQAGMITADQYWKSLTGAFADLQNSAGMQYMQGMAQSILRMGQLVPSSGVQIMDIGASRFSAPGQAASMSASEAASMMGGGLEDINRQQLTAQKNIEAGINQVAFLLARGLI